ncbi:hypothetical protein CEXT_591051 [Caerostris extrusa]|uniref:Uncharacterized protein n=1 Tax=Caerostris extrusa TaxID=172846 RepID=A0AAV4UUK8_CAEEX|nr:hypothetical protein CEXT_591051 [Caerostris extrusa]
MHGSHHASASPWPQQGRESVNSFSLPEGWGVRPGGGEDFRLPTEMNKDQICGLGSDTERTPGTDIVERIPTIMLLREG